MNLEEQRKDDNRYKMEFLFVGSYQQLSKVQFESVTVGILKSSLFPASAIKGMVLKESPREHSCSKV